MTRKKLIAGNWKMNKTAAEAVALVNGISTGASSQTDVDIVICPPFTSLETAGKLVDGTSIALGAQNMHNEASGAYTGEISAAMLCDLKCSYVLLGHSERRTYFNESDAFINKKLLAALKSGLKPVLCVGETLAEREDNQTLKVIQTQVETGLDQVTKDQIDDIVIAYEPVWAIGTGKVATTAQAQEVHAFIRQLIAKLYGDSAAQKTRILYGGSMKPDNAPDLLAQPDIDGGLIGGASLDAKSFLSLVTAAAAIK